MDVDVEQGLMLVALVLILLASLDDLLEQLNIEALALGIAGTVRSVNCVWPLASRGVPSATSLKRPDFPVFQDSIFNCEGT